MVRTETETTRILIADDQADVLEALQILLKNDGFVIEAVNSPRAVLEALENRSFDVVLLDMNYARDTTSGGEGLAMLPRIRQLDDTLPVVFMTAWGSIDLAVETMQGGGRDFVQKPWDNAKLLKTLRRQVEEGRRMRAMKQRQQASQQLLRELEEAGEIQRRLFPESMPRLPGLEIQAYWRPAHDIGGDYFDAIRLGDHGCVLCIADVMGKGLPAALLMSNTQAAVRATAPGATGPGDACRRINRIMAENTASGQFVTMFYAMLDGAARTLWYTNAGHAPPILIHCDGTVTRLNDGGPVLGVFPDAQYAERRMRLEPGDRLALFTDGVTEVRNSKDEEFGEDRWIDLLRQHRALDAGSLRQAALDAVESFADRGFQDDAALMIVSVV